MPRKLMGHAGIRCINLLIHGMPPRMRSAHGEYARYVTAGTVFPM